MSSKTTQKQNAPIVLSHLIVEEYLDGHYSGGYFLPIRWSPIPCEGDLRRALMQHAPTIDARLLPHIRKNSKTKMKSRLMWWRQEYKDSFLLECAETWPDQDGNYNEGNTGDTWAKIMLPKGSVNPSWIEQWRHS